MADGVNEWTFCTEHRKAVDGGSCDECNGDRHLVQVVRRYYLDVARNQLEAAVTRAEKAERLHECQHGYTCQHKRPVSPGCTCPTIQALDARRHFRECPQRALYPEW